MGFLRRAFTGAICLSFLLTALPADQKFALTIDNIMRGPGLYGYEPTDARWSGDSQRIYFHWKQASDPQQTPMDTYVVNRDGSGLRKLTEGQALLAPPAAARTTRDHKRAVWEQKGDLYFYDYASDQGRQLTKTAEAETSPRFTFDEKRVTFLRGGKRICSDALDSGMLEQLTETEAPNPTPGVPKITDKGTDSQEFLKKQEKELLESVREKGLPARDAGETGSSAKAAETRRAETVHRDRPIHSGWQSS